MNETDVSGEQLQYRTIPTPYTLYDFKGKLALITVLEIVNGVEKTRVASSF